MKKLISFMSFGADIIFTSTLLLRQSSSLIHYYFLGKRRNRTVDYSLLNLVRPLCACVRVGGWVRGSFVVACTGTGTGTCWLVCWTDPHSIVHALYCAEPHRATSVDEHISCLGCRACRGSSTVVSGPGSRAGRGRAGQRRGCKTMLMLPGTTWSAPPAKCQDSVQVHSSARSIMRGAAMRSIRGRISTPIHPHSLPTDLCPASTRSSAAARPR